MLAAPGGEECYKILHTMGIYIPLECSEDAREVNDGANVNDGA